MATRIRAWLRLIKMRPSYKTLPLETISRGATPSVQKDNPPPSYSIQHRLRLSNLQPPREADEDMAVAEALRARNPSTRPPSQGSRSLHPPPHRPTPIGTATAAASSAMIGVLRALDEEDPRMVAARTAQAIAVAASTAPSYASFVAAVTAAESTAFLILEEHRNGIPNKRRRDDRARVAIRAAVDTAMSADAGTIPRAWPHNVDGAISRSLRNKQDTNAKKCHVDPRRTLHSCPWEVQCPCREGLLHE